MKKKFILWIVVCVVIGLFCILCVKSNEEKEAEDSYARFTEEYENISKKFSLDGFERVGKDNETFGVAFPENKYFEEKDDSTLDDQPVRRTLYYKNKKDGLVLTITHLYSEKKQDKHLVSMESNDHEIKNMPKQSEYYMTYGNSIVSFKLTSIEDKKSQKFEDTEIKAFKKYVSLLKDEETKNSTKK